MLDTIRDYVGEKENPRIKIHRLREFLQLIILEAIYQQKYFKNIAFLGGTALRILYKIKRYSEDLDFSMVDREDYDFEELIEKVTRELQLRSFDVDIKMKKERTAVRSCFFRFKGLLYQLGLSPLKDQKIAIKFDIDENPPLGFSTKFGMLPERFTIGINSFDEPSLFAGKLHAILNREYTKGRDYFDLLWFISSGVKPNIKLLENALEQSRGKKLCLDIETIKQMLKEKILETDFDTVIKDLKPFIIDEWNLEHYNQEVFLGVVERQF